MLMFGTTVPLRRQGAASEGGDDRLGDRCRVGGALLVVEEENGD
jgi:hypothetical protein